MKDYLKNLPPALFLIILLCFFLPFVSFKCQGQKIFTVNGYQLAFGSDVDINPTFNKMMDEVEKKNESQVDPEPGALMALISAAAGLLIFLLKLLASSNMRYQYVSALLGFLGFIFLLILQSSINDDISEEGQLLVYAEYGIGFYLSLIAFIAAGILGAYGLYDSRKIVAPDPLE